MLLSCIPYTAAIIITMVCWKQYTIDNYVHVSWYNNIIIIVIVYRSLSQHVVIDQYIDWVTIFHITSQMYN